MAGIGDYKMVRLYEYTFERSVTGDLQETKALRAKKYAVVEDNGGGRSNNNGLTTLDDTKVFLIRWKPDWSIKGTWRVRYFGKDYTISKIERINEKRFNWRIIAKG